MSWLSPVPPGIEVPSYPAVAAPRPDVLRAARAVAPGTSAEALVAVEAALPVDVVYARMALPARGPLLLRAEALRRLVEADSRLPEGFRLVVLDGWRDRAFQAALLSFYRSAMPDLGDGFVSDAADEQLVPPHVTGGAVDLTLAWDGLPLALGTDYDAFDGAARPEALESHPGADVARDLRRMLAAVLREQGFAPYPLEWWHWSYGDQIWAAEHGHAVARYGEAAPTGEQETRV